MKLKYLKVLGVCVIIVVLISVGIWEASRSRDDPNLNNEVDNTHDLPSELKLTSSANKKSRKRLVYFAKHVQKGCRPNINAFRYYSQSQEDFALFKNYFNSPTICRGVYVEIGALDGVRYSNTKFFEDYLNWTGVLIEAQPQNARKLKINRSGKNNVIFPEAVCPEGQEYVNFTGNQSVGGIPDKMTERHIKIYGGTFHHTIQVPCRPIGTMLRNAGITAIDFFIIDVEGAELMVLETMDWTIPVKAFVIEMGHGRRDHMVRELLQIKGYKKSIWNIAGFCLPGKSCTSNQVFEHPNYNY